VKLQRALTVLVLAVVLPLLLSSCTQAPKTDAPVQDAPKTFKLTIIGTADLQGMLEPSMMKLDADGDGREEEVSAGGIARIATLIRQIQDETENPVVVVSAGDDLMNRYFHTFKGQAIFGLMSDAGYELYAFGNHEFDKGPEVLAAALDSTEFECICTDLAVEGTPLEGRCAPWLIKDYEGLKVGFFSLMTEGFPYVTSGKSVEITGTNLETAHRAVRELRGAGAQLVVGLTHVGYGRDLEIARSVPGIDVIFGGHSHEYAKTAYRMGGTIVVNGGEKGPYLVRLDLTTNEFGKLDLANVRSELIPVTDAVPADEDIEAKLAVYQEQFPEAIVLGQTEVPWDMTKDTLRRGESPVANLVNDRMRDKFRVDIVLNNAGAFRGKKVYQPGPVTDVMLHEIDEFSQGRYILEVLERSAASFGGGGLLHAAGLRYTVDLTRTEQELRQSADGTWSVSVPGERVVEATVLDADGEWKPLDPDRDYTVLSNSFIVQHEGDGYFWFKRYATNAENTYSTFYSILAEIACNEGVLNPEAPDGRLKAVQ
jgi:5'-nucleotidase